jgi:hypothetical protein
LIELILDSNGLVFAGIGGSIQKDFVDPAMRSPMLVAGGEAVVPAVAEAVAVARERGIFLVWVSFAITILFGLPYCNFCAVSFCSTTSTSRLLGQCNEAY